MNFQQSEEHQERKMLVADEKADNLKCLVGNWPSKQLLQKVSTKVMTTRNK